MNGCAAGDAAGDVKPMTEDFLDDGSAVEHCEYELRCDASALEAGCNGKVE